MAAPIGNKHTSRYNLFSKLKELVYPSKTTSSTSAHTASFGKPSNCDTPLMLSPGDKAGYNHEEIGDEEALHYTRAHPILQRNGYFIKKDNLLGISEQGHIHWYRIHTNPAPTPEMQTVPSRCTALKYEPQLSKDNDIKPQLDPIYITPSTIRVATPGTSIDIQKSCAFFSDRAPTQSQPSCQNSTGWLTNLFASWVRFFSDLFK